MKLFLQKNNDAVSSRYVVLDELGHQRYLVTGDKRTISEKIYIKSLDGTPLVSIRVTPAHVLCTFSIKDEKERFLMTLTGIPHRPSYKFYGISWYLKGGELSRSFEVVDADNSVVMIQNAGHFAGNGYFELDIKKENRELFCIATAVCANVINYVDLTATASV